VDARANAAVKSIAVPTRAWLAGRQSIAVTAAARVGFGVVMLARPASLARSLGVDRGSAQRTAFVARFFGARDLVLGASTLVAVARGRDVVTWAWTSVASDVADAVVAAGAARAGQVAPVRGYLLAAVAVAGAAGGVVGVLGLRRPVSPARADG
jgi:hypothetical protein